MVKMGVFGKHEHVNHLMNELVGVTDILMTGFYCPFDEADLLEDSNSIKEFQTFDALLHASDALYITDVDHDVFHVASIALRNTKHVFIEQISSLNLVEVETLLNQSKEANVKCVIGSKELAQATYIFIQQQAQKPELIETQRQLELEQSVQGDLVFDFIMKDIVMILQLVKSDIKRIVVKGSKVFKEVTDVLNVRLEFANGCIANSIVNTSAWSNRSKMLVYEAGKMISADFNEHKVKYAVQLQDGARVIETHNFPELNSCKYQLENFINHILHGSASILTLRDGYEKLSIAYKIAEKINSGAEE